jgi:hypothetical protein
MLEEYTTKELCSKFFCGQTDSMQRIFIKKYFLFMVGIVCCVKWFITGQEVLSRMFQSCRWCLTRLPCWYCATVQWVKELIRADRRITIYGVAAALGCSHGLAYSMMHDRLKFQKVCIWWVPRELRDWGKMNRLGLSLQHLLRYADEEDILNSIVTGDESGVHHY